MDGRDERMRRIELSNLEKVKQLPDLLQGFYYSMANKSPNTKKQYMTQIVLFFKYSFGEHFSDEDILSVTGDDINAYLTYRQNQQTGKSIMAMQVSSITKLYSYLLKRNLVKVNPVDESSGRPHIPKKDEIIYLEEDEIQKMFDNIRYGYGDNHNSMMRHQKWCTRNLAIIYLFVYTGIRKTALADLNVSDVDLDERCIRVVEKGENYRKISLNDQAFKALTEWMNERTQVLARYNYQTDALFVTQHGRISVEALTKMVQYYTGNIDKHISPHKLRSTFGTMYYRRSGGDLLMTQEAMGHADVRNTQRYAVPDRAKHKSVLEAMAQNIK